MLKFLKGKWNETLCKYGFHKMQWDDFSKDGIAGGSHCIRPECTRKSEPIKWPRK